MKPRKAIIAATLTASLGLGADAAVYNGNPIAERNVQVASEMIEVKQNGNVVETTLPWKDAKPIKVKYDMGEATVAERIKDKRDQEVITETVDFGDGGFKIDILLNEKPDTNHFCYQIENAADYDFFYQPPLTQQEIDDGASRPEHIVGSYAVYHKTKRNHKLGEEDYATGKVMHIPRPEVWEVGNKASTTQWADLSYADGELCVTVDRAYLAKASYPVRVDPTFGYTSIGASYDFNAYDADNGQVWHRASQFNLPVAGEVTGMDAYFIYDPSGTFKMALSIHNTSLNREGYTESLEIDNSSGQWYSYSMNSNPSLSSGDYWLGFNLSYEGSTSYGQGVIARYDSGGTSNNHNTGSSYSGVYPPPSSITSSSGSYKYSIYATYTASEEGEATTTPVTTLSGDIEIQGDVTIE